MANPRTSDDLYGAFLPTSRITDIGGLEDDRFSFTLNGEHVIVVGVRSAEAGSVVWAEFAAGPRRTLLEGGAEECQTEYHAIHRFLLNRWRSHVEAAQQSFRRRMWGAGAALVLASVGALGVAAWSLQTPAGPAVDWNSLFAAGEALEEGAKPVVPAKAPLKPKEEVSKPSFLEAVRDLKDPAEAKVVLSDPAVEVTEEPKKSSGGADLLERFGMPKGDAPAPGSSKPEEGSIEELRKRHRDSIKNGIALFPDPDGVLAKPDRPVLQMPGGGTLEDLKDLNQFGLTP